MERLSEKEWKAFPINAEFRMKKQGNVPTGALVSNSILKDGMYPRIRVTSQNNGINGFTNVCDDKNYRAYSNFVSMSFLGNAFYHPYTASLDMKVHCLQYKDTELNPAMGLFTVTMAERIASGTNYGNQLSSNDLAAKQILLPVDDKGNPDYAYMAEYVQQKRDTMLAKYRAYVEARIAELGELVEIPVFDEKEWKHFRMPEIFGLIQRGKRLKNADHVPGIVPYVSSTANNNGVDDYIEATPGTRAFGDCISLANSGSVGTAFYEPFEYVASDHVTALKTEGMSKYVYLFLIATIEKQGSNFNFNREINDARIKNMQIMLPVDDAGEPDYAYMEQYSKNMMLRKYRQYLEFINRQNATEVD